MREESIDLICDTRCYRIRKVSEEILRLAWKLEAGESQASAAKIIIQSLKRLSNEAGSLSTFHGRFINLIDLLSEISPARIELIPALRRIAEELITQHTAQFHQFPSAAQASHMKPSDYRAFRMQGTMELGDVKGAIKEAPLRRKNWELKQDPSMKCEPKEES